MIVDLTDAQARAALPCKWGMVPKDVLPAWVAEMDYALAPPITEALHAAVEAGMAGYPYFGGGAALGEAYAGFASRHWQHTVDPEQVMPVADVTAGVRLALDVVSDPGPMVMPVPAYPPQLEIAQITGRERWDLIVDPSKPYARIDLDELDKLFARGARTLLLTQPHNPWGRVFSGPELEGIRDVVAAHNALVISDEIHAPLVLPGATHTPYLSIPGTADHTVAVVAASKAFNIPGLKCAQIVTADPALAERLRKVPMARNDSWSTLGVVGSVAAYTHGDEWLAALIDRLDAQRSLLSQLLSEHLPEAKMRPLEATYLAWIDLSAYGYDDPATRILEAGRVQVSRGSDYHSGLAGHIRLNIATSPDRLTAIVTRMGEALT